MKHLIMFLLVFSIMSCSTEKQDQAVSEANLQAQKEMVEQTQKELSLYLEALKTDIDRKKNFIKDVKLKPGNQEWKMQCFRKHYPELKELVKKNKDAYLELQQYATAPSQLPYSSFVNDKN